MRKRRITLSFLVIISFVLLFSCYRTSGNLTVHNIYKGEITHYTVFIEDIQKNNECCRRVYLTGLHDSTTPHSITGYNINYLEKKTWDHVFLEETDKYGQNRKQFMSRDENRLNQYSISYPQIKSPTETQMRYAKRKLYEAMNKIHNQDHLIKTL